MRKNLLFPMIFHKVRIILFYRNNFIEREAQLCSKFENKLTAMPEGIKKLWLRTDPVLCIFKYSKISVIIFAFSVMPLLIYSKTILHYNHDF